MINLSCPEANDPLKKKEYRWCREALYLLKADDPSLFVDLDTFHTENYNDFFYFRLCLDNKL